MFHNDNFNYYIRHTSESDKVQIYIFLFSNANVLAIVYIFTEKIPSPIMPNNVNSFINAQIHLARKYAVVLIIQNY